MDLVLRTPRLELRLPDDAMTCELARLARAGVEGPGQPQMVSGWTKQSSPQFERHFVRHTWKVRAGVAPRKWTLGFAVLEDGEVLGVQALRATDFPTLRAADSGSWLGVAHHGRGIGTEMRAAVLEFAFAHLGAVTATTGWTTGNAASERISAKLGYRPDGFDAVVVEDKPVWHPRARVGRATWLAGAARPKLEVEGLEGVLPLLLGAGVDPAPPDAAVWPGAGGPPDLGATATIDGGAG